MPKVNELPWIVTAESLMFTNETPGSASNPRIMRWAKGLGSWVRNVYTDDSVPWCGLFVAHCMNINGIKPEIDNPLSALAWNEFGVKTEPCYGAVIVFKRTGGGHVGFVVSHDDDSYHVLGGNQSDSVNITRVDKSRFVGCRWPRDYINLKVSGLAKRSFSGQLSKNEA